MSSIAEAILNKKVPVVCVCVMNALMPDTCWSLLAGLGVPQDEERASHWYEQVADVDIDGALFEMGMKCMDNKGLSANAQAASWLSAAASKHKGSKEAQYKLAHYYAGELLTRGIVFNQTYGGTRPCPGSFLVTADLVVGLHRVHA